MKQFKYHYFYRIENLLDGKYYYGIHSTDNLNDKYMGSGRRLKEAIKLFGKENFEKTILKYFDSREKASEYETLMVTEDLVHDKECYNIKCGGDYGLTSGTFIVKDKDGKWTRVTTDDERYLNGELVPFMSGLISVYDKLEEKYKIIDSKEYQKNKGVRYVTYTSGKLTVKDKDGNTFLVDVTDERYLNGELKPIWCGKKHSEESKEKMREKHRKNKHQSGDKNSQYGTVWITKDGENQKIQKEELDKFISLGWVKGRKVIVKAPTDDKLDLETVKNKHNELKTWSKVAREFNMDKTTLIRYAKRHNIF